MKQTKFEQGSARCLFSTSLSPFYISSPDWKKQQQTNRKCWKVEWPSCWIWLLCISLDKQDRPIYSAHIWNSVFRSCNDTLLAASLARKRDGSLRGKQWLNHNHSSCTGEVGGSGVLIKWFRAFKSVLGKGLGERPPPACLNGATGGVNTEPGVKGRQSLKRRDRIAEKRRRESATEFCAPWGSRPASSFCRLYCIQVTGPAWHGPWTCSICHFDGLLFFFFLFAWCVCVVLLSLFIGVVNSRSFMWFSCLEVFVGNCSW